MARSRVHYVEFPSEVVLFPDALGYVMGRTLGQGAFGKVKAAWSLKMKKVIAIKIVKTDSASRKVFLSREIAILRKIHHPQILRTYCIIKTEKCAYFIQEIAVNGDLWEYMKIYGIFHEAETHYMFKQMCKAMAYCHQKKIAHRDLKCENILLDENLNIKIGDFGLSADMKIKPTSTLCGSLFYVAPELRNPNLEEYDGKKADVWSLGVILFTMTCGYLPFHIESSKKPTNYDAVLKYPASVSISVRRFIQFILNTDPNERPYITNLLSHCWIKQGSSIKPCPRSLRPRFAKAMQTRRGEWHKKMDVKTPKISYSTKFLSWYTWLMKLTLFFIVFLVIELKF